MGLAMATFQNGWEQYIAWHPIYTQDAGMLWAWPWKSYYIFRRRLPREAVYRMYEISEFGSLDIPVWEYRKRWPKDA